MLKEFMPPQQVALDVEGLDTPEDVLRFAAQMMVSAGKASPGYVEQVVQSYQKSGPYFVIAPGIALPHIRPSDAVFQTGICFVRLKEPVAFGHPGNDPVKLVFLLAGTQSGSHLEMIGALGNLMGNEAAMAQLYSAKTLDELMEVVEKSEAD